jgi:hypothetical protein
LDSIDQNVDLKKQCLASLSKSIKKIQEALGATRDQNIMIDRIWEAYSQVELSIGLAKLAFRDKLKTRIGKFREFYAVENPGRKNLQTHQKLELDLSVSKSHLQLAVSNFDEGNATEGLEQARKGRDILKSILLENSSTTNRRKKNA